MKLRTIAIILLCVIFNTISFAQNDEYFSEPTIWKKFGSRTYKPNPTTYPYGGFIDKTIGFSFAEGEYPNLVKYKKAIFFSLTFEKDAFFKFAIFDTIADFSFTKFQVPAIFVYSDFRFNSKFRPTMFKDYVGFRHATFRKFTDFSVSEFSKDTYFTDARFLKGAKFDDAVFYQKAFFNSAMFDSTVTCHNAKFLDNIQLEQASFKNDAWFDFGTSTIYDTVTIGRDERVTNTSHFDFIGIITESREPQNINFLFTSFPAKDSIKAYPDSTNKLYKTFKQKIILKGKVNLKIQLEKFHLLEFDQTLNYFARKNIISELKQNSFDGQEFIKERFELDYLLAKSTMYISKSTGQIEKLKFYNSLQWWINSFYFITMGLGYRPFWLFYYALILIFIFSIIYFFKMRYAIADYIHFAENVNRDGKKIKLKKIEHLYNSIYFSTSIFLRIIFPKKILILMNSNQKKLVITEYLIGISFIIYFILGAKPGSIVTEIFELLGK